MTRESIQALADDIAADLISNINGIRESALSRRIEAKLVEYFKSSTPHAADFNPKHLNFGPPPKDGVPTHIPLSMLAPAPFKVTREIELATHAHDGFRFNVDPNIPPGTIHIIDTSTGRVIGKIENI